MTALHTADNTIDLRQALATGRFYEAITNRAFGDFSARLEYSHPGGAGSFSTQLAAKPGGYFSLHLHPGREMPDLSAAGAVTLRLLLSRPGEAELELTRDVTGAELALVETAVTIGGNDMTAMRVSAAPFVFTAEVLPAAVLLDGSVLIDNDPEQPADGVSVTAAPAPPVLTDAEGRFRIPALPVTETVTLSFDHGGDVTEHSIRPDYSRAAMTATFSISSS